MRGSGGCAPRRIGWSALGLVPFCIAALATLLTPAAFPIAALGVLLFLVWVATISLALARAR
jgi:hypothetical protein